MARRYSLFFGIVLVLISACAAPPKVMTPLEIQSIQTREYEASKNVVFPSVISVFQDLAYTITSADKETGFISAESASQSDSVMKFWLGVTRVSQTKATGFIERIGSVTRVRLNFVEVNQTSSNYGQSDREDTPILEIELYQNAFDRVENAIFLRSG